MGYATPPAVVADKLSTLRSPSDTVLVAEDPAIGALVAAAEAFAWQRDCRRVEVTSGDHREDAHTFYRALGYEMDERRFIKHRSPAV
ncbi:MAG: hypothetical protein DMD58_01460 [Gemmatimonadetes bacterium]|nr:MAG: hypothetical protein DMD58_01460 [Gemmatimonadota bacterium]